MVDLGWDPMDLLSEGFLAAQHGRPWALCSQEQVGALFKTFHVIALCSQPPSFTTVG